MTFEEIIAKLPKPYYSDDAVAIIHADCRDILPLILDKSIDLVLTDPPYGLCDEDGKIQMRGEIQEPDYKDWDTFDITAIRQTVRKE